MQVLCMRYSHVEGILLIVCVFGGDIVLFSEGWR